MNTTFCVRTGQIILLPWLASVATNQGFLSYTIFLLYLTTYLYWGVFNNSSLMRAIDMFTAIGNISLITWHYSYGFCSGYRTVWIRSISFSGVVYIANEVMSRTINHKRIVGASLVVHGVFLHLLPAFTFTICVLCPSKHLFKD